MSKLTPIQRQLLELKAKNSELAPSTQASRASALGSSSGSPAEKSIDMSWVIDRGDLERKLAQVRTWLRTGLRVKVTVKAPRKDQRRVSTDEARALVAKIEAAAREGAIPDGGSSTLLREPRPRFGQLGGQLMMWFVGPPPAKSAEKKKR